MIVTHNASIFRAAATPVQAEESITEDQPILANEPHNKVCLFLAHVGNLILVVRYHAKDNSVSIEPPGGKIDPKDDDGTLETPAEALAREGFQEIGVLIAPDPVDLNATERHPYTQKLVGNYYCKHVEGTPWNKAADEHLGIIEIPLNEVKNYDDLVRIALNKAQVIVDECHTGEELSRPIECRVSKKAFMNFHEHFQFEMRSDFTNKTAENSLIPPMPA